MVRYKYAKCSELWFLTEHCSVSYSPFQMGEDIIAFPITRQQLLGLLRKPTTALELDSVSDISEFRNIDRSVLTGIEEVYFD